MTRHEIRVTLIGILAIGIFLGTVLACSVYLAAATGEEMFYNCWVICSPESEVMIREKPNRHSDVVCTAECGRMMWTDCHDSNGWVHLVDVSSETGEGWVSEKYVVYAEPTTVNRKMVVSGSGRVACREGIDGKIKRWARKGTEVTVYIFAEGWAVTDKGYIRKQFLKEKNE